MYHFLIKKVFIYIMVLIPACFVVFFSFSSRAETSPKSDSSVPEYRIGVEDVLNVFVWKEEDLNRMVVVRPDGKISFPLVGDIEAAGLTCRELADKIKEKLLFYIKDPNVTVIVEQINSFKVYVVGSVNRQGVYVLKSPAKILQVLAMAEGLNEYAKKSDIVVIRREENKERMIKIDYRRIVSGEKPDENIYIRPDDTVIVN